MSILNKIKLVDVLVNGHEKNGTKIVLDDLISNEYSISELNRISNECNIFVDDYNPVISMFINKVNNVEELNRMECIDDRFVKFIQYQKSNLVDVIKQEYIDNYVFAKYINYSASRECPIFESEEDFKFFLKVIHIVDYSMCLELYEALKDNKDRLKSLEGFLFNCGKLNFSKEFVIQCVSYKNWDIENIDEIKTVYNNWSGCSIDIKELTSEQYRNIKNPIGYYTLNFLDKEIELVSNIKSIYGRNNEWTVVSQSEILFENIDESINIINKIDNVLDSENKITAINTLFTFTECLNRNEDFIALNRKLEEGYMFTDMSSLYLILYDVQVNNIDICEDTFDLIKEIKNEYGENIYKSFALNSKMVDDILKEVNRFDFEHSIKLLSYVLDFSNVIEDMEPIRYALIESAKSFRYGNIVLKEESMGLNLSLSEYSYITQCMGYVYNDDKYIDFLKALKKDRLDILNLICLIRDGICTKNIYFDIYYIFDLILNGKISSACREKNDLYEYINGVCIKSLMDSDDKNSYDKILFLLKRGYDYNHITPLTLNSLFDNVAAVKNFRNIFEHVVTEVDVNGFLLENFICTKEFECVEKYLSSGHITEKNKSDLINIISYYLNGSYDKLKYDFEELNNNFSDSIDVSQFEEWKKSDSVMVDNLKIDDTGDFKDIISLADYDKYVDMKYRKYNIPCLLSNFDANKRILRIFKDGILIARAVLRFCDVKYSLENINGNKDTIVKQSIVVESIYCMRRYANYLKDNVVTIIDYIKNKAGRMNCRLFLCRDWDWLIDGIPNCDEMDVEIRIGDSKYGKQCLYDYSSRTINAEGYIEDTLYIL